MRNEVTDISREGALTPAFLGVNEPGFCGLVTPARGGLTRTLFLVNLFGGRRKETDVPAHTEVGQWLKKLPLFSSSDCIRVPTTKPDVPPLNGHGFWRFWSPKPGPNHQKPLPFQSRMCIWYKDFQKQPWIRHLESRFTTPKACKEHKCG